MGHGESWELILPATGGLCREPGCGFCYTDHTGCQVQHESLGRDVGGPAQRFLISADEPRDWAVARKMETRGRI